MRGRTVLVCCVWVVLPPISFVLAYENLALKKPAWQLKPYLNKPWGAERAVDGLYTDLSSGGGQCVISGNDEPTAEWGVDLGDVLSIHHIFIQYRTDNVAWSKNNGYTARFLGFSVYISNSTNKDGGVLCFKDTSYTRATIPNPTNITCTTHGRYVIYYNNRTNPLNPVGYDAYAFNELCEVEVHGCTTPRYYGEDCSMPCPQNCFCHIVDGTCLGCIAGYMYKGHCTDECSDGTYGQGCINTCGNCSNGDRCNHVNGSCPNGCDAGVFGDKCDQPCPSGWYGPNCTNQCGMNCYSCNRFNGDCEFGCTPGRKGRTCDDACDGNMYGIGCSEKCGSCFNFEQCHHLNGTCMKGCDRGFHGSSCIEECSNGSYGYNCKQTCSTHCQLSGMCDRKTGHCHCQVGWKPDTCDSQCDGGKYGQNCTSVCDHCIDKAQCHYINGICFNGCDNGYRGSDCTQVCNNDTYGTDCSMRCGKCLYLYGEQCHHVTGHCPRGCGDGFQGDLCDQVLESSSDSASTSQLSNALYASVTIVILSVALNVFFIIRQLRNNMCRKQKNKETEQSDNFSKSVYDKSEDNTAYQELGEITKESQYDKLSS